MAQGLSLKISMIWRQYLAWLLLLAGLSCEERSPHFPTSVRPPERPPSSQTVTPMRLRRVHLEAAPLQQERVVRQFFFALGSGNRLLLQEILAPSAVVIGPGKSRKGKPASAVLDVYFPAGSSHRDVPPLSIQKIDIIEIVHNTPMTTRISARVKQPRRSRGLWTFQIVGNAGEHLIQEINLPHPH